MRIAITGRFENSYFSGATTQVAIALARALTTAGHNVELLAPPKEALWFIDCKEHAANVPIRKNYNLSDITTPYDILVEVVWNVGAQDRPKVAKKTILFAHYPPLFHDMESSVYQFNPTKREFTNLHGIWTWDHYQPDDIRYLEFLSGVKVSKLPFVWDSQPLDIYEKESNLPPWSESAKQIESKLPSGAPSTLAWCLRITESNMSNSSSAVLPINIVSAIRGRGDNVRWMIHNGDGIAQSDFFKSNIIKNCNLGTDISGSFVGRLRLPDMRRDKTVLVAHQRWRPLKATLLDALYLGIPMIHNCQIAKSMGGSYYYELNQIQDAQEAWIRLKTDAESGKGFFHPNAAIIRKKTLQGRFGPTAPSIQEALQAAIKQVETAVPVIRALSTPSSILRIAFVDMADSKFFYDLLTWAGAHHNFTVEMTKTNPNLIVYGASGTEHQAESWKSIPKIFYTRENTPVRNDYNTLLNIGFMYPKQGGTPYIRVPSWMLQIDWFRTDPSKVQLTDCLTANPSKWDRFCSFIETDPGNPLRNAAFQIINQYKPVEAAGPLFCNRVNGPIEEQSKVDYYKSSKFVLAFENASSPGYCTEKLFHAKVAGAIPIYWGDPLVTNDFEEAGFFHAGTCGNGEDLLKQLKELDADETRCKAMQAVPALSDKKHKECTATMGMLVKAFCAIGLRRDITVKEEDWSTFASAVVASVVAPLVAPAFTPTTIPPSLTIRPYPQKQCFVTAANAKYIESAKMLLDSVKDIPKVLYVWSDVSKESTASLTDVDVRILPTSEEPWIGFWEPQHFAWKLWVLHDAGTKVEANTAILYLDAGVFLASSITKIWNQIEEHNVFLLNDDEQTNERWCHPDFCKSMSTTSAELKENQITAGLIGYKVGSHYQSDLFEAALQIAKTQPNTIQGHKWRPYSGVCFGHRHDQSILSILSSRCKAPRLPLKDFYCDHSLKRAQAWGTPLYVHRGQFKPFVPITTGIGEVFVINADKDTEQLAKFKQHHPTLYKQVYKWRGMDALTLSLTSSLARLFRDNNFQWNKAAIASAVSHLGLWERCANDSYGQPYLILEDTVQLCSDWESKWNQAVASLPAEAEIVHLGSTLLCMTDPVNPYFRKRTGGTIVPSAYLLTQKGARSLITSIQQRGIYTTLEALLCEQSLYCINNPLTISTQNVKISTIAFTDMWPGFNYNTNFIMDSLRQHTSTPLQGKNYIDCVSPPSVVIIGPYSDTWKSLPDSLPKVFFTAENWNVPSDPRISLYLTPSKTEDATHMRLPTWMMFIDWYIESTALPEQSKDNPIRLPLYFAKTVPSFQERSQFCGFVVSNPVCKLRNDTFQVINNYKRVNSGGALYNNIGGQLALLYPGGGCGDLSKHQFFKQHKFTISFENSQAPGYITEKVLHSKMAGCIPLYWGDKDTDTDFAPNSIVNVSHLTRAEDVLDVLKQLEQDPVRCHQIATTPILNEASHQKALQILKTMSERILSLCNQSSPAKIAKTFVINLDTRQDRWKSLIDAEPSLQSYATRVSAVNGKTLTINSMIYNLFHMNQFQWKKSIIGCNLSHISIWSQIVKEEGDYFLVLEDDVRFAPNWMETWKAYAKDIPADADLLYLGGILPPNKPALPSVLEPVNAHLATIKPNTLFSQTPIPLFHFCTYSYIISKKCAQKLLDHLRESEVKFPQVVDHFLGYHSMRMRTYVATSLLTHCFQDLDPKYQQSHFNDLQRQDTFDSDIWNNKERFTELELLPYRESFPSDEVVTHLAAYMQPMIAASAVAPVVDTSVTTGIPVYIIPGTGLDYEKQWLEDMFQSTLSVKSIQTVLPKNSILLIQRTPPTFQQGKYKEILDAQEPNSVILLHISDENGQDPILLYNHPSVKHVIRNYYRKDCADLSKVTILPLGYSTKAPIATPTFSDRSFVWSFAGSIDRPGRQEALSALEVLTPFEKETKLTFGDPSPLKGSAYTDQLLKSKFIPAFRGFWSLESFRLYEALEAGCIPLYVPSEGTNGDEYTTVLGKSPILALPSWTQAPTLLEQLSKNAAVMEQHRQDLQTWWKEKKQSLRTTLSKVLSS